MTQLFHAMELQVLLLACLISLMIGIAIGQSLPCRIRSEQQPTCSEQLSE